MLNLRMEVADLSILPVLPRDSGFFLLSPGLPVFYDFLPPVLPGDSRIFLLSPGLPVFYDFVPVFPCLSTKVFL